MDRDRVVMVTLPRLVLASLSPRRSEILSGLGLRFTIEPADIDESRLEQELPDAYVDRVARAKAQARVQPHALVLAADTIVVHDRLVLTKPEGPDHAREMLTTLAGREHEVLTAIALADGDSGSAVSALERSRVTLAPMTPAEIDWYVGTEEPLDKAGGYAIQGLGSLFVERISGSYTNVVGLPVTALYRLVRQLGYSLLDFRADS